MNDIDKPYWEYTCADTGFIMFLGIPDGTLKHTIELIYERTLQGENISIRYNDYANNQISQPMSLKEAERMLKLNEL